MSQEDLQEKRRRLHVVNQEASAEESDPIASKSLGEAQVLEDYLLASKMNEEENDPIASKSLGEAQVLKDYLLASKMNEEVNKGFGVDAVVAEFKEDPYGLVKSNSMLNEQAWNSYGQNLMESSSSNTNFNNCNNSTCPKLKAFLVNLKLEHLQEIFDNHGIDFECLSEMTGDELREIGIWQFGFKSKIKSGLERLRNVEKEEANEDVPVVLVDLDPKSEKWLQVVAFMNSAVREHRGSPGGTFKRYKVLKVENVRNDSQWKMYEKKRKQIAKVHNGNANEQLLFHGSINAKTIALEGFDITNASDKGMFGQGHYFTDISSKANQYTFGGVGDPCEPHKLSSCYECERQLLVCRVTLGKCAVLTAPERYSHPPPGCNSVYGKAMEGFLDHDEYVIYCDEQVIPIYFVTYKTVEPTADAVSV